MNDAATVTREQRRATSWVKSRFPAVAQKRHAFCKDCGTEYGLTKRTYCPRCDTHTVDAWQFRFDKGEL